MSSISTINHRFVATYFRHLNASSNGGPNVVDSRAERISMGDFAGNPTKKNHGKFHGNHGIYLGIYPLVMTNIAMGNGPNRNRWFTELKNLVIFHGELLVITRW